MGVSVETDENQMKKVTVTNEKGASVTVMSHGGHVVSWKNKDGDELLFVSKEAVFKPPKAIRGGIPVCFPQFADCGPLGQHGFARNSEWAIYTPKEAQKSEVTLVFAPSEEQLKDWPHPCELSLTISLAPNGSLSINTKVRNNGDKDLEFTYALHTYFAVPSISEAKVIGLKGVKYLDSLQGRIECTEEEKEVVFPSEVDRIYLNTPDTLKILASAARTFTIKKSGLPDAVVWNPWINKSKAMGDFGDEEYKEMVCVEAGLIKGEGAPLLLGAGQYWTCDMELSADTKGGKRKAEEVAGEKEAIPSPRSSGRVRTPVKKASM